MKQYFALTLISIVVLGGCTTSTTPSTNNSPSLSVSSSPNKSVSQSLKELFISGTPQKCTWQSVDKDVTTVGQVLVNGKKFKQTTQITDPKGVMTVYAISDGNYMYSWNDGQKQNGFKIKIPDETSPAPSQTTSNQSVDLEKKYDYVCAPAVLSDADLSVPSDVKFNDFSETIEKMKALPSSFDINNYKDLIPKE